MFAQDFPVFKQNPSLIYFDNASTTQKPSYVIDKTNTFISHSYANIHRGMYTLAEQSEMVYDNSKKKIAGLLGCLASEIIYGYNATHCSNLLAQSLVFSGVVTKDSRVLLGVWDHHAAIVPWQLLAQQFGFHIDFIHIKDDYSIDRDDFQKKYTDDVAVVSCGAVSNVTGHVYDLASIKKRLREETFFVVDAAQAMPHFIPSLTDIQPDAMFFTAHKVFAYTGLGVLYLRKEMVRRLQPLMGGGGIIEEVTEEGCRLLVGNEKFEAGTPNVISAASFLYALEYIESIGGYEVMQKYEKDLVEYMYQKFQNYGDTIQLVAAIPEHNVGVFSFTIPGKNIIDVNEVFADNDIAMRCGGHCAHPLLSLIGHNSVCRISINFSNTKEEIDRFFKILDQILLS